MSDSTIYIKLVATVDLLRAGWSRFVVDCEYLISGKIAVFSMEILSFFGVES